MAEYKDASGNKFGLFSKEISVDGKEYRKFLLVKEGDSVTGLKAEEDLPKEQYDSKVGAMRPVRILEFGFGEGKSGMSRPIISTIRTEEDKAKIAADKKAKKVHDREHTKDIGAKAGERAAFAKIDEVYKNQIASAKAGRAVIKQAKHVKLAKKPKAEGNAEE